MAAIGSFLADDWVIVDADGTVIDRSRFLDVIESGALSHESMESTDVEVRLHGDIASHEQSLTGRDSRNYRRASTRGSALPTSLHA